MHCPVRTSASHEEGVCRRAWTVRRQVWMFLLERYKKNQTCSLPNCQVWPSAWSILEVLSECCRRQSPAAQRQNSVAKLSWCQHSMDIVTISVIQNSMKKMSLCWLTWEGNTEQQRGCLHRKYSLCCLMDFGLGCVEHRKVIPTDHSGRVKRGQSYLEEVKREGDTIRCSFLSLWLRASPSAGIKLEVSPQCLNTIVLHF